MRPPSFSQNLMNGPGKPPSAASSTPASSTITGRFSNAQATFAFSRATSRVVAAWISGSSIVIRSSERPRISWASRHLFSFEVTNSQPVLTATV